MIFLSYPSEERETAERTNYALLALGHDVFLDRADLGAGEEYNQRIAREIAASDLFVFFISPASVAPGRYTLTELGLAERKWPHPSGRVLPVMLRETPITAIPAYLRAVNFLVPRGDPAAETAQEAHRLIGSLPFVTRAARRVRSRSAAVMAAVIAVAAAVVWAALSWDGSRATSADTGGRSPAATYLPPEIGSRARAVAPMADGGFVVAAAAPSELLRFSAAGLRVGEPIALRGEPVGADRTPTQIMIISRAPDGVTIFDWNDLRLIDTLWLDPSRVTPPYQVTDLPRLSGDIQSVAVLRGMLWVVTGDRDGEPAVLRYRTPERRWEVPGWSLRPEGIIGGDADGLVLRLIGQDLWGVTTTTTPASLYHLVGTTRIDEIRGHDVEIVSCASDIAATASGNPLLMSCDSELQEVAVDGKQLRLVRTRPTLPRESGPTNWTSELLVADGSTVVVALNTEIGQPFNRPGRARIAEVDSAGKVMTLLDEANAVVRSMAVTPRQVVAVLRRAEGGFATVRAPREP